MVVVVVKGLIQRLGLIYPSPQGWKIIVGGKWLVLRLPFGRCQSTYLENTQTQKEDGHQQQPNCPAKGFGRRLTAIVSKKSRPRQCTALACRLRWLLPTSQGSRTPARIRVRSREKPPTIQQPSGGRAEPRDEIMVTSQNFLWYLWLLEAQDIEACLSCFSVDESFSDTENISYSVFLGVTDDFLWTTFRQLIMKNLRDLLGSVWTLKSPNFLKCCNFLLILTLLTFSKKYPVLSFLTSSVFTFTVQQFLYKEWRLAA